jgi:hypothetical protein
LEADAGFSPGRLVDILQLLFAIAELRKYEIPKAAESDWRILMLQLVHHPSFISRFEWLKTLTPGRHHAV